MVEAFDGHHHGPVAVLVTVPDADDGELVGRLAEHSRLDRREGDGARILAARAEEVADRKGRDHERGGEHEARSEPVARKLDQAALRSRRLGELLGELGRRAGRDEHVVRHAPGVPARRARGRSRRGPRTAASGSRELSFQDVRQPGQRASRPRLHRSERDVEELGDLTLGEAAPVGELDQPPLLLGELGESTVHTPGGPARLGALVGPGLARGFLDRLGRRGSRACDAGRRSRFARRRRATARRARAPAGSSPRSARSKRTSPGRRPRRAPCLRAGGGRARRPAARSVDTGARTRSRRRRRRARSTLRRSSLRRSSARPRPGWWRVGASAASRYGVTAQRTSGLHQFYGF